MQVSYFEPSSSLGDLTKNIPEERRRPAANQCTCETGQAAGCLIAVCAKPFVPKATRPVLSHLYLVLLCLHSAPTVKRPNPEATYIYIYDIYIHIFTYILECATFFAQVWLQPSYSGQTSRHPPKKSCPKWPACQVSRQYANTPSVERIKTFSARI